MYLLTEWKGLMGKCFAGCHDLWSKCSKVMNKSQTFLCQAQPNSVKKHFIIRLLTKFWKIWSEIGCNKLACAGKQQKEDFHISIYSCHLIFVNTSERKITTEHNVVVWVANSFFWTGSCHLSLWDCTSGVRSFDNGW